MGNIIKISTHKSLLDVKLIHDFIQSFILSQRQKHGYGLYKKIVFRELKNPEMISEFINKKTRRCAKRHMSGFNALILLRC